MAPSHPLSFQLYSARNFPPLESELRIVAEAGFTNVEAYGGVLRRSRRTRALIAHSSA